MVSENLKDNLNLVITMIVILLLLGVVVIWGYNFIAKSNTKLFDDENKYIDSSLANPDVEDNYKETYKNKLNMDKSIIGIMNFFKTLKGIFVIAFIVLLLLSLILKNRKSIIDNFKNMFS